MPGPTTRKAFAEFLKPTKGDICIIPTQTFAALMTERQQRDDELCKILNRIATAMETGEDAKRKHFHNIEMKLDQLIIAQNDTGTFETYLSDIGEKITELTNAISHSSINIVERLDNSEKEKESINKKILKLKDLRGQYLRSEKTSELMEDLLAKDAPYVQRKFRVKVSKDTHDAEMVCYKDDAIYNAKAEISKMKVRMRRWDEDINILKEEIATSLSKPNLPLTEKNKYEQQILKNEELNNKERDDAVKKINDSYELDIKSGAEQFLLKYTDETDSGDEAGGNYTNRGSFDQSKNYSGRFRQRGSRRNRRPRY